MTVGDIHWIELPPGTGHEQSGRRPAVVVQDESYAGTLPVVLVVPLTTAAATLRFPGTVLIQPDSVNGLHQPSVALVFQMRAIDRRRVGGQIGALNATGLTLILAALDRLMGR
ncbi:MAG: type II toxin-antitoxin system PemK/MazF family toxin [Isosphaeraceae bacterium]